MNYPQYYGNYLGIVVQNNDPLKRGRVKVFVPHISPTVYKNWTEIKRDKKFKFVGVNTYSDLTDVVEDLKKILPWAECAAPLAGQSSSGRYNVYQNTGSISSSNKLPTTVSNLSSCEITPEILTKYTQNRDGIGEKPGNIYDANYFRLNDAFSDPKQTNVNNVNKLSYAYTPECYSNSANGAFAIPNVGSHLWVFFNAGDPLRPVYFASSFGAEDWRSIFDAGSARSTDFSIVTGASQGMDYPGEYENKRLTANEEYNINTENYRNKYVINQKGGTLQFVNSDNREMLKMTHFSGSFKEFNNYANIELATANDQKLVIGDQFLTVRGDRNEYTEKDHDFLVKGDYFRKIGNLNADLAKKWKAIVSEIADLKQLFDIQRTNGSSTGVPKLSSKLQKKLGRAAPCPVCSDPFNTYFYYNNSYLPIGFTNQVNGTLADSGGDYLYSMSIVNGVSLPSVRYPGLLGTVNYTSPNNVLGGSIDGSVWPSGNGSIFGAKCPCCNGTTLSPSSYAGDWVADGRKSQITAKINNQIATLAEIEKKMGLGGNEIVEITKHKIETIGTVMNDFGSIRVDPQGKIFITDVQIAPYGVFYNRQPSPLIEYVHVDDLPGGNYTLNVCNRYNVQVGSGGINLKTYGPLNIAGAITNIAGEQVNIASENEINIDGGRRLSLIADIISIRQRNRRQVVIEGNLGITANATVAGSIHVEGEIFTNHVTAPVEIQATEQSTVYGAAATDFNNNNGKIIGFGVPMSKLALKSRLGKFYTPNQVGTAYIGKTDSTVFIGKTDTATIVGYLKPADVNAMIKDGDGDPCSATGNVPIYGSNVNCVKGTDLNGVYGSNEGGTGATAESMPIIVYGTGRDDDSIKMDPHSHLFKNLPLTLYETNSEVRKAASNINDGAQVCCNPVTNNQK